METTLQLDPERCILVLGPQIAAECLPTPARPPPALSYNMLLEAGVQKMLDLENSLSTEEKIRRRTLLVNAYELDPSFVGNVVVNSLKKHGSYEEWLTESFSTISGLPAPNSPNHLVEKLQSLLRMGTLMIYTYYDMVLDRMLGTQPVLMENEEDVRNWANRQIPGVLHVHGIHTQPGSVCCDCVNYQKIIGGSKSGRFLREICKTKTVIFVGFDGEFFDPFMPKFSSTFVDTSNSQEPPLLLSSMSKIPHSISFLTLRVPQMSSLGKILTPSSCQGVSREALDSSNQPLSATLLYADKKSCLEAAEKVKTISSVNVHQLTMRHEMSHELVLYLDREGLKSLWNVVFSHGDRSSGLHAGLLGVKMISNLTVWLDGPANVRLAERTGHMTAPITRPPSLSTSVSVIPSMYTPIASTSVSQPPKHLTPSTRPTLPSPLVTTTSRTLLAIGRAGKLLPPEFQSQVPILNPQSHPRRIHSSQLRKARSAYYDRVVDSGSLQSSKKNGLLLHRESAPEFVYTPEGVIAYKSSPHHASPKPNSASQPSPLLRDGSNVELRIEYIDQYQEPNVRSGSSPQRIVAQGSSGAKVNERGTGKTTPDFKQEKQKYISDALQFSKKVESSLAKKVVPPTSLPAYKGALSLNTNISPEEQEKILQQHFEQVQRSSSQLKYTTSASRLAVATTPTRSPGLSSPNRSPRLPSRKSPIPASLKLPAVPGTTLPSSINPLILRQSSSSTVFPFFGTNPPLPGTSGYLPSPAAMSQYAVAGSGLNPYQTMMHYLAQQGNKPMIVTDPSLLQGLQGNLPETVPCFLPDGTVTLISTKLAMQAEESGSQTSEENKETSSSSSRNPNKRGRTPEMDKDVKATMPKRRRSNSLPDISQLGQVLSEKPHEDSIQEEDEEDDKNKKATLKVLRGPRLFSDGLRPRDLPPPNMIQIPQETKVSMGDPMLGFPTPQSSPSCFTISPFIMSTPSYHHPQPMTPVTPNHDPLTNEELKDFVEDGDTQAQLPPSPGDTVLPPFPQGRGPIQLWQFLLDLLLSPDKQHMIQWTGNGYEFRIVLPEDIAKLWGARKNKPRMNYDKLSRGLRYYYSKGIMDKVPGKKLTFKYTCDVQQFIQKKCVQGSRSPLYSTTPLTPMSAHAEGRDLAMSVGMGGNNNITYSNGSLQKIEGSSPQVKTAVQASYVHTMTAKPSLFTSPMLSETRESLGTNAATFVAKSLNDSPNVSV